MQVVGENCENDGETGQDQNPGMATNQLAQQLLVNL